MDAERKKKKKKNMVFQCITYDDENCVKPSVVV